RVDRWRERREQHRSCVLRKKACAVVGPVAGGGVIVQTLQQRVDLPQVLQPPNLLLSLHRQLPCSSRHRQRSCAGTSQSASARTCNARSECRTVLKTNPTVYNTTPDCH